MNGDDAVAGTQAVASAFAAKHGKSVGEIMYVSPSTEAANAAVNKIFDQVSVEISI